MYQVVWLDITEVQGRSRCYNEHSKHVVIPAHGRILLSNEDNEFVRHTILMTQASLYLLTNEVPRGREILILFVKLVRQFLITKNKRHLCKI